MPKLHFSPSEAAVSVRKADDRKQIEQVPLSQFVQQRCPSLLQPFQPAWWLFKCVHPFISFLNAYSLLQAQRPLADTVLRDR